MNISQENSSTMVTEGDERSLLTICFEASTLGLIIFAAVVGNTLILASLYRFTCLQTKTNAFVLNLAIADLFLAVFAMPFTFITSIKYEWIFGKAMCQILGALNSIFCEASIMTLTFVSLERFVAIVFPLKYETLVTPRRVKFVIGYIWIQAVLCASSTFIFSEFAFLKFESICTVNWGRNIAYTLVFVIVFLYVPFLVTAVLYCVILQTAIKQRRRIEVIKVGEITTEFNSQRPGKKSSVDGAKKTTKEHKATVMIAIVVGTFCVCWFPHSVGVFCILDPNCNFSDSFFVATTWLAMLNSAMNSLIYGLMNRSFRRAFKSVLFCERYVGNADLVTNILQERSDRKSYGNVSSYYSRYK
ncbi:hypothetical protein ACROYT_G020818 [Oculina patagonica]